MALALVLGENKTPPERVAVSAVCTLDELAGVPRITTVELAVRAQVPGLDAVDLKRMVEQAGNLCPVSNALRGNVKIDVRTELSPGHSSRRSHSRQEAEVEHVVRTLRGYGVLTRARLLELCGAGTGPMGAAGERSRTPSPAEGSDNSGTTSTRSPTPRTDERPAPRGNPQSDRSNAAASTGQSTSHRRGDRQRTPGPTARAHGAPRATRPES